MKRVEINVLPYSIFGYLSNLDHSLRAVIDDNILA